MLVPLEPYIQCVAVLALQGSPVIFVLAKVGMAWE